MTADRIPRRRQRKPPEIRVSEILGAARRLFFARGYDSTSVNDIIAAAGLSKGAFYHHFDSKDALLEALALELSGENLDALRPLLEDGTKNAVERLNGLFAVVRRSSGDVPQEMRRMFRVVFLPENVALLHRLNEALLRRIVPLLAGILAEGARDGTMRIADPSATAEMLVHLRMSMANVMNHAMTMAERGELDAAAELLDSRMLAYGVAVDRVLGLPDGTIVTAEPGSARAMLG